jgi:hypothetical protein
MSYSKLPSTPDITSSRKHMIESRQNNVNGVLFSPKKEVNHVLFCFVFPTEWLSLEYIIFWVISQVQKDKYTWSNLSVESKKCELIEME